MITHSLAALRVAPNERYTEEASFRSVSGTPTFSVMYVPDTPATTGVIICPSILIEMLTNYRYEVLLARALASRGMAVHRFHYRGTGHSGGEDGQLTTETMVEDTLLAAERLREHTGVGRLAFVGTRWGTVVATVATEQHPASPLVLWAPVMTGEGYFNELIRARLVRGMNNTQAAGRPDDWKAELARTGRVDVLGHALYQSFLENGRRIRLSTMLMRRIAPTMIVQLGPKGGPRRHEARWAQDLVNSGMPIQFRFVPDDRSWFFPQETVPPSPTVVSMTADWLAQTDRVEAN